MNLSNNEMTDKQIIKALEHCSSDEVGLCHICPLDGECNGDITILLKYALDLINRQKAEIERLTEMHNAIIAGQETLQKALAERNAEIERLLTEFARLKEETKQPYLLTNCDDKLVEVLRKVIKNQNAVCIPDNGATVEFLDKASIKAEAIKEFAEKLKSKKTTAISCDYLFEEVVRKSSIDNLVKEMTEPSLLDKKF